MIIDIHTHIAYHKLYPKPFLDEILSGMTRPGSIGSNSKIIDEVARKIFLSTLSDESCSKLISQMDEAKISKSVLLIPDFGYELGEAELNIEEIYKTYHDALLKYPNRFIIFGGIDPRRGNKGIDLFEKGIIQYNFSGLKLYPPCGFELDSDELWPLYELCSYYKLAVMIHCGPSSPCFKHEKNFPQSILDVSNVFKDINFILAHAAIECDEVGLMLVKERDNIFLDLSAFQVHLHDLGSLESKFSTLMNSIPEKVLFGTDWPMFRMLGSQKRWVDTISKLFCERDDCLNKVFYENSKLLLGKGRGKNY